MKTIFSFVLLCSIAAFGQSTISSEPYPIHVAEHIQHASQHAVAQEQSLLNNGGVTTASGERKASDVTTRRDEVSLGEAAREIRKAEGKKTILDK
jgi:hypothetical protein